MKYKTKSIIKKVALALAGIVAVSAVGVGVAKLIEFMQDDFKTISPSFDVGNLGADGKYVNDESTLYTKEAFQCDGLQIKLDFDNEIDYQIFFYDDLDNFIESTEVLSAAYSETVHDGYARIVIIPNNDEDDKIGLTERLTYPGQLTIKVAKEQNVEYVNVLNKRLRIVSDSKSLRFRHGNLAPNESGVYEFVATDQFSLNSIDLLSVKGGSTVSFDITDDCFDRGEMWLYEFKTENGVVLFNKANNNITECVLSNDTDYIVLVFRFYRDDSVVIPSSSELSLINNYFIVTK